MKQQILQDAIDEHLWLLELLIRDLSMDNYRINREQLIKRLKAMKEILERETA